jgi:hypothetical protein
MNAVIELVTLTTGTLTVNNQPDTEAVLRNSFFDVFWGQFSHQRRVVINWLTTRTAIDAVSYQLDMKLDMVCAENGGHPSILRDGNETTDH